MRRGLVHAGAWVLAGGAAVTLSWFGIHVVSDTVHDGPPALPVAKEPSTPSPGRPSVEPETDSTRRPGSSPSTGASAGHPATTTEPPDASGPRAADRAAREGGSPGSGGGQRPREASGTVTSGTVESHDLRGGRVVFDLGPASATLVSAAPNEGWEMRVWRESHWIRVTFTRGGAASSAHCVWNGSPPRVVIDEHGG
ncbi:hypothetical protein [Streptomyces taklimakanensis]|nr:hypothetical protein [Streptomyces taklimakanensis]